MNPIDIIIITFNRNKELYELLLNIQHLEGKDQYLNKVIVIDNNQSNENENMIKQLQEEIDYTIDFYKSEVNLGVARGRNLGIKRAEAEWLFFIDDDAEIESTDSLKKIYDHISVKPDNVAIFSLRIVYFENHKIQKTAFPHKKFKKYQYRDAFQTSYFIGAGHIIRKKCLLNTSFYPEDIFYGMEEYDLGYQIISKGYKIEYTNCITILHKESSQGRQSNLEKSRSLWLNKTVIVYTYLPRIYFISTSILWSLKFLKDTKMNVKEYVNTFILILNKVKTVTRKPLSKDSLKYLKSVEARLWY